MCVRRVNLLVCSLPLHRHSYIGFMLAFALSIHNKQQVLVLNQSFISQPSNQSIIENGKDSVGVCETDKKTKTTQDVVGKSRMYTGTSDLATQPVTVCLTPRD